MKITEAQGAERIKSRCIVPAGSDCWEYQGHRNRLGYAQVSIGGKLWMAHRLMYWVYKGPFDLKQDVCHTCDNPPCCNPDHLWLGDPKANAADCIAKKRHYKVVRTHCVRGHEYAVYGRPHYTNPRWRICILCERDRYQRDKTQRKTRVRGVCRRGHKIEGENAYRKPNGQTQCKICHDAAVEAWLARGKVPLQSSTAEHGK